MIVFRKLRLLTFLTLVSLLLVACGTTQPADELHGRMLLWHTWSNGDAAALNAVLSTFNEIHANVNIKQQQFTDMEELLTQFQVAADAGLGPDLIIASGQEVRSLADAHLLKPIDNAIDDTIIQRYDPAALDSLRYQDALYGLPVSMDTLVLYYDTSLVKQPAATLDALLAEAAQGRVVAMSTNFTDAFWGVQAFGGSLFDDEHRVILDRGGFANWLAWLKEARDAPGMLLDSNREVLRNRFIEDGVAYYVGYASEYSTIVDGTEEMPGKGEDAVGVATLPSGPTAAAAPFLTAQAFLFSAVSSENQRHVALELAKFVTNAEQQSTLMRETGLVSANNRVRVNPRLNPVVAIFTAQARAAVPILNIPEMDAVFRFGGDAYTRVLEGVLEPAEASATVTAAINEANHVETLAASGANCGVGTLYLGYLAGARRAAALDVVLDRLQRDCPLLIINPVPITLETTTVALTGAGNAITNTIDAGTLDAVAAEAISARLATALTAEGRVDLLLAPHRWIPALVAQKQLRDLSALLDGETLQRYRPMSVEAMRYQGGLYGLPMSVSLDALYYNRTLVTEPARTLDELQQQTAAGLPVVLDYTFRHSFWGIPAFGGQLLDDQGNLALTDGGFADWLSWLQSAEANASLTLLPDRASVLTRFREGSSAYYLGGPEMWQQLQQALGSDTVGVARLPSGPAGDAGPLLTATGLLFSNRLSDTQTQTALTVANYLTSVESQTILWERADQIPTNIGLDIPTDEPLSAVAEQARTAVLLANAPVIEVMMQQGDSVYRAVLVDGAEPATAVEEFVNELNATVGAETDGE